MIKKILIIILTLMTISANANDFELLLGHHQVEYFADRIVFKVKKAGFTADKVKLPNGMYKVSLKSFKSKKEAEEVLQKIKKFVPDIKAKIIP